LIDKRIEIAALHRNGHEFPVELTITALRHGSSWRFTAFVHDITDRYRANEFQARLATIVEHSADAIIARTRHGHVTAWNPAAEALFGYTADEMLGQTLDRLLPDDRRGELQELLSVVLRGEPVRDVETMRVSRDGQPLDVSLTMSPIRDDAGEVGEISMIVRDIRERKRAERAVERARRARPRRADEERVRRDRLTRAANATHLDQRVCEDDPRALGNAYRRRKTPLPGDRRPASRPAAPARQQRPPPRPRRRPDDARPQPAPVPVVEVARAVLAERRAEDLFQLRVHEPALAHADPDHVHQILANYVANALAYGSPPLLPRHPPRRSGHHGTRPRRRPRRRGHLRPTLFETFTRATKGPAGTGLGLAIVKRLATSAGGDAWHEPNSPRGACFCVSLPAPPY